MTAAEVEKEGEPVAEAEKVVKEADTHAKIAAYCAKYNLVRLFEDLVAFLIQHHPNDPWKFLSTHYAKIVPQLRQGACLSTLLKDMEVEGEVPSVIEEPTLYQAWLNENGVYVAIEELITDLVTNKVADPYRAILINIKEHADAAKAKRTKK